MDVAELVLDRRASGRLGERRGGAERRQRADVVAHQRAQVADALVRAGRVGIAERERGVEVVQRVGVGVQRRRLLGRRAVLRRRGDVVAGEAQVLGDERGALAGGAPAPQRGRDAAV